MLKKFSQDNFLVTAALLIGGFFGEGAACSIYVVSGEARRLEYLLPLGLLHVFSVMVFSSGTYAASRRYNFGNSRNWFITAFLVCAFFPGIGIISICLLFAAIATRAWQRTDVYDEYERYISFDYTPEERRMDEEEVIETVSEEVAVQPLVDVMLQDDTRLRRGAVNVMRRLPKKDAVRLLKQALMDKSVEIRFYAAVGLSEIEGEITGNIEVAIKQLERNPNRIDVHVTLANSYVDYFESGILDDVTAAYYRDKALSEYYLACELGGGRVEIFNSIAKLETEKKDYDKALKYFNVSRKLDPGDAVANLGVLRILYDTGRMSEAAELAGEIRGNIDVEDPSMRSIVEFWAGK